MVRRGPVGVEEEMMENVIHPMPTMSLLKKAVWKLYQKNLISNPISVLADDYGVYGYEYRQFILVAKKAKMLDIVSVHRDAVLQAVKRKIPILMWLDEDRKFYIIDPYLIFENNVKNMKGDATMYNFGAAMLKPGEFWEA